MARRIMFVQQKTGYDIDQGPSCIAWVEFNRSWKTARFHGRVLRRSQGFDSNFYDVDTDELFWVSGPKRDRSDTRYGPRNTVVDEDAREVYQAFLQGGALPGRENG